MDSIKLLNIKEIYKVNDWMNSFTWVKSKIMKIVTYFNIIMLYIYLELNKKI